MTFDDVLDIVLALVVPFAAFRLLAWLVYWCLRLVSRATQGRRSVRVDAQALSYRGTLIDLDALASVRIVTTAAGPFVPDVFWVFEAAGDARLVIPQEAPGFDAALARLQQLPRFDNEAVIRAMTCTEAGEFPCWQADGS